jgi:hypothetical protein
LPKLVLTALQELFQPALIARTSERPMAPWSAPATILIVRSHLNVTPHIGCIGPDDRTRSSSYLPDAPEASPEVIDCPSELPREAIDDAAATATDDDEYFIRLELLLTDRLCA